MQGTSDIDACLAVSRTIVTLQAEVGENAADDHRQAAGCGGYRRCIRVAGVQPRLTETDCQQAMVRWQLLRPVVEDGISLPVVARSGEVPGRTLRRWLAAYRAGGLAALVRRPHSDRGCRRMPPELPIVPAAFRKLDAIAVLTGPLLPAALIRRQMPSWRRQGRPAGRWLKFPEADRPRGGAGAGGCGCTSPRTRHPRRPTAAGTATGYRLAAR